MVKLKVTFDVTLTVAVGVEVDDDVTLGQLRERTSTEGVRVLHALTHEDPSVAAKRIKISNMKYTELPE